MEMDTFRGIRRAILLQKREEREPLLFLRTPPEHSWGQGCCHTLWIISGFLMRLPHALGAHCLLLTVLAAGPWLPCLACSGNFSSLFCFSALYFPHSVCEQQPNLVQHLRHGPLLFLKRGPHPNSCPPLSSQAFFLGVGRSQTQSIVLTTQAFYYCATPATPGPPLSLRPVSFP